MAQSRAFELFMEYAKRFREVKWRSAYFKKGEIDSCRFVFFFTEGSRSDFSWSVPPSLNLRSNGLSFSMTYDPAANGSPQNQMESAICRAIDEGPFKGVEFFADPDQESAAEYFQACVRRRPSDGIKILLSHSGEEIEGLFLPDSMQANSVRFFIPKDSLEYLAIDAAFRLEQIEWLYSGRPDVNEVAELRGAFELALSAVPA